MPNSEGYSGAPEMMNEKAVENARQKLAEIEDLKQIESFIKVMELRIEMENIRMGESDKDPLTGETMPGTQVPDELNWIEQEKALELLKERQKELSETT